MTQTDAVPGQVREACAWVMARAGSVQIDATAIDAYAAALPAPADTPDLDAATHFGAGAGAGDREARAAFAVCLDAINFGSGWWPTIRKRPGHSGYLTIAAGLTERFREVGPWPAGELAALDAASVAAVLGQDPDHPLMADFAASLRDVGAHVDGDHGGSFAALADAAAGSAVAFVDILAGWESFADTSAYLGREVPFFKRAQIAAADLDRAGVVAFDDLDRLTAFADNLVPHVLRVDGVLRLAPSLTAAIEAGELLEHGSPEEVELRAAAVHVAELLAAATGGRLNAAEIDAALWNRGRDQRYKALPRPRSRCTAY